MPRSWWPSRSQEPPKNPGLNRINLMRGPARGRGGVYKCLSLTVGFAVTVAIWPREAVSCRELILRAVATFLAMSLVGIYPGRASYAIRKV